MAQINVDSANLRDILGTDAWRLTPATFAMEMSDTPWVPAPHLLHISSIVARALIRGNARLLISVPPRHGKSELLSVNTPQWILDRNPASRIILTGYGADLTRTFSRRVRDNLLAKQQYLNVKLDPNNLGVDDFMTTQGGGVIAAGVNGPITGRGADVFLVDDYVKNQKEAASIVYRNDIYEWFIATAYTRLEPGGSVIVIATRWHIDDLIGRLRKMDGKSNWIHIEMEAINSRLDDPMHRSIGEPLWPERYNRAALEDIKTLQGNYFWSALYQQRPIAPGANLFTADTIYIVDIFPKGRLRLVRAWDMAATASGGDYTAGYLLGADYINGFTYLLDAEVFQGSPFTVESRIKATAEKDGHDVEIHLEQEPGSAGKALVEHYKKTVLKGYKVSAEKPTGQKFIRAQPFMADCEAGKVRMLRGPWNNGFIEELKLFPEGDHDDQVDSVTGAFKKLWGHRFKGVTWGKKAHTPEEIRRIESQLAAKYAGGSHRVPSGATWGRG